MVKSFNSTMVRLIAVRQPEKIIANQQFTGGKYTK